MCRPEQLSWIMLWCGQDMFHLEQEHIAAAVLRVGRFLVDNERLLVVAASTMIMSLSHTALRPVLPVFAKVWLLASSHACSSSS